MRVLEDRCPPFAGSNLYYRAGGTHSLHFRTGAEGAGRVIIDWRLVAGNHALPRQAKASSPDARTRIWRHQVLCQPATEDA